MINETDKIFFNAGDLVRVKHFDNSLVVFSLSGPLCQNSCPRNTRESRYVPLAIIIALQGIVSSSVIIPVAHPSLVTIPFTRVSNTSRLGVLNIMIV